MRPYTQAAAIELPDGRIITADASPLLGSSAALLINVMKELAGIDHAVKLIPQNMIEPIQHTKIEYLHGHNPRLHTDEVLVALSVLSPHSLCSKDVRRTRPSCSKMLTSVRSPNWVSN